MNFRPHRVRYAALVALILPLLAAGCEDIDWDWEASWWHRPSRQVRPDLRTPPAERPARQEPSDRELASADRTAPAAREPRVEPPPPAEDAFYQLYLISEPASLRSTQTVARVRLEHVTARLAARAIEQLYLPVGGGGAEHQYYIIYQDRDEWSAAVALVPLIDVAAPDEPVGAEAAYRSGLSTFFEILRAGAAPPQALIERGQSALTRAGQSFELDARRRWVATILAGRLAADQLFDYTAARGLYEQAERIASPGSVEHLAALWWGAESFDLEGNPAAAAERCSRIIAEYGGHSRAQAVQRARSYRAARGG